jgi:hypothetical protein
VRLPSALSVGIRFVTWASVGVSFLTAAVVFRTGAVQQVGYAVGLALLVALAVRVWGFEKGAADLLPTTPSHLRGSG